jgi:site-specific DNA recombinase
VSRPLVTETAKQHPGAWRIPATQLEHLIATEAAAMLAEPGAIAAVLENAGLEPEKVPAALAMADRFRDDLGRDAARGDALAVVVNRIELSPIRLRVILSAATLVPANPDAADAPEAVLIRDVPLRIKRRGVEMRLIIEGRSASPTAPDPVLLKEIRRAHRCFEALVSGQVRGVAELATIEGISDRYVSSLLPLAFLAPDIVDAIAAGRQPPDLTAHRLIRTVDLPIAWTAQKQLLGLV